MSITQVTSSSEVSELANRLLDPQRSRPCGIVTLPVAPEGQRIDAQQLDEAAGDVCDFFVIQTGPLSRELDTMLPDRCQVYGGAARIYPVGLGWMTAPEQAPLRFLHDNSDPARVTDRLITDALGIAHAAGLFAQPAAASVRASGEVRALLAEGTRAFVLLDSGEIANIAQESMFPDVPLKWFVQEGQRVDGQFDPKTKRLALDLIQVGPAELLEFYPHGTVTLALVVSVERQSGVLSVHPSLPLNVTRRDVSSNPYDRVDLLLAPGDVVHVRVIRDEQGRTGLRLHDIDDDETVQPALSLLPGGNPWLAEDRHLAESEPDVTTGQLPIVGVVGESAYVPADTERGEQSTDSPATVKAAPTGPKPTAGLYRATTAAAIDPELGETDTANGRRKTSALESTQLSLQQAKARIQSLEAQIKELGGEAALERIATLQLEYSNIHAENYRLRKELRKSRADQQEQRTMLRKSRRPATTPGFLTSRDRFDEAEDWVRHGIYLAWIDRLAAADRKTWPLPEEYGLGERFASSLEQMDEPSLGKALKAVVDVLTGRVRELQARSLHPLREGEGMTAADVVREDGARCMRVHIEKNVPSARRLHYWQLETGAIELSRVVLHDDMVP